MTRNIQEAIKIVMELMVFGVVVLLVSLSVNLSSTVNNRRLSNENLTVELQKQSMLYSYDGRVVVGDDIIVLANKYAKALNISVQLGGSGSDVWFELTPDSLDLEWDSKYIKEQLGNGISVEYNSILDRDINGNIVGVIFSCI